MCTLWFLYPMGFKKFWHSYFQTDPVLVVEPAEASEKLLYIYITINYGNFTAMKELVILLVSIPFLANAQEAKRERDKNISLGFSFSPGYNYRSLKNNDGSSSSDLVIKQRDDIEKGKLGFTTGFDANIQINRKFEIQTGILYCDQGFRVPKRTTLFETPAPGQPTHFKSKASFNYLGIPLKLNFFSGKGRIKFITGAGLAANFLLRESEVVTLFYADGSEKQYDQTSGFDYDNFNLSLLISAGTEIKLNKNIFLRAVPTFRYGLTELIDQPVTEHLWNIGLDMGVYLRLR